MNIHYHRVRFCDVDICWKIRVITMRETTKPILSAWVLYFLSWFFPGLKNKTKKQNKKPHQIQQQQTWAFGLLEIRFQRPRFESCIQQRKKTCLLSIRKSLACARASKSTTANMYIASAKANRQWGRVGIIIIVIAIAIAIAIVIIIIYTGHNSPLGVASFWQHF